MLIRKMFFYVILSTFIFASAASAGGQGKLTGQFNMTAQVPNLGGIVMLYNKNAAFPFAPKQYRRMPDYVDFFNKDGRFTMRQVPAGEYYLEAAVRTKVNTVGPPGESDYFYLHRDQFGQPEAIAIEQDETHDLGSITQLIPFQSMLDRENLTGCEGTITDSDGNPISYALVFVYTSPELSGSPVAVSEQSDSKGRYLLGVPKAGSYYLKADEMKSSPVERTGIYGESEPKPVTVETGKIVPSINIQLGQ